MVGASFRLVCSFPLVNPDLLKVLQQALEVGQAPWQGLAGLQGLVLLPALGLSFTRSLYICKMSTPYSGARSAGSTTVFHITLPGKDQICISCPLYFIYSL